MPSILRFYMSRYAFEPVRDHLRIAPEPAVACAKAERHAGPAAGAAVRRVPVTLVIPCYNEESVLPYLRNTLSRVAADLGATYDLRYVFVDDGSSDGTWSMLKKTFERLPNCKLVRHDVNRGVAAAILTGIRSAGTEVVCSIDCDCTYDPHQLRDLIPKLEDDVAVVTASPYHPSGRVLNVPPWRLLLSRTLSGLYRCVFHQQLHTYTSCLRVYRRSQVQDLVLREGGFLGVAEFLMRLDLEGKRIVEHPAVLEVRLLGHSKMKLFRTIRGHLRLLWRMAMACWGSPKARASMSHQKE